MTTEQKTEDQPQQEERQPTPEEMQKLNEVGQAGAQAAAEGKDIGEAMKKARDATGLQMSDEELEKVGEQLFGKLAALFEERGAFDLPPAPVEAPQQPPPAPEPPKAVSAAEQVPEPAAPAPQKRTPAQKFFGVD
jgi:hypothetical protein